MRLVVIRPIKQGLPDIGAALKAESEIRDLPARYTDAIYRKDWDALRETWATNGVWHAFGARQEGRENIVDWVSNLMAMFRFTWMEAST